MKKNKVEVSQFLAELEKLTIEELLYLFIEAKTGDYTETERLPEIYVTTIYAIGMDLNHLYADRIKGKPFS